MEFHLVLLMAREWYDYTTPALDLLAILVVLIPGGAGLAAKIAVGLLKVGNDVMAKEAKEEEEEEAKEHEASGS